MLGWSSPGVWGALLAGVILLASFLVFEAHVDSPMLPLSLFARRNFAVTNAQTLAMYGGIGILGFFVTIYLQQVAGYSAFESGVTGLVPTAVMFTLSGRFGALADRYGSRSFLRARRVRDLSRSHGRARLSRFLQSCRLRRVPRAGPRPLRTYRGRRTCR